MNRENVIKELNSLIQEGKEKILPTKWITEGVIGARYRVDSKVYIGWHTKALAFLRIILPKDNEYVKKFAELYKDFYVHAEASVDILNHVVDYCEKGFIEVDSNHSIDAEFELERIFSKFHKVARQLRSRYNGRTTIDINDEYDVQDLLHALLKLFFDDIRAEEWTPSYAGKSARMDFLLKQEKIVIEVKKTRMGLGDKEIGDQLIIDVDRYKSHPDCKKLLCFIYDPEGRIGNPNGLINDINKRHQGFVEVLIEPMA